VTILNDGDVAPPTPPAANNDTVLTNITDFSDIVIPSSALLYNDTDINNDPLTVTSVQNPVDGNVALGSAVFDPTTPAVAPVTIEKVYNFNSVDQGTNNHRAFYFEVDPPGSSPAELDDLNGI